MTDSQNVIELWVDARSHRQEGVGKFQKALLILIQKLGRDAWAQNMKRELESISGLTVDRGQVYSALKRLKAAGLVRERSEKRNTPNGTQHEVQIYALTAVGVQTLKRSDAAFEHERDGAIDSARVQPVMTEKNHDDTPASLPSGRGRQVHQLRRS